MVHLVEKVILIIQVLSTILQVSTILQSTIAGFYCTYNKDSTYDRDQIVVTYEWSSSGVLSRLENLSSPPL